MLENKNRWLFHEVAEALYIDTSQIVAQMDLPEGPVRVVFRDATGVSRVDLVRDEDGIYQVVGVPEYIPELDSERMA